MEPVTEESRWPGLADFTRRLLVAAVIGLAVAALVLGSHVLLLFFAGCLLAVALRTPAVALSRVTRIPVRLLTIALLFLILFVIVVLLAVAGGQLAAQFGELQNRIPATIGDLQDQLAEFGLHDLEPEGGASRLFQRVSGVLTFGFSTLFDLVLVVYAGAFLAVAPDLYREGFISLFPLDYRARLRDALDRCSQMLAKWLTAQLVLMVVVGTIVTVGLWLLGVPLYGALGLIAGLAEFVPVIGPILAAIPAILTGLSVSQEMAVYVLLLYVFVNQVEGNLLLPLIQQEAISLPPALTILGTLFMATVFGVTGLVLAVPLVLTIMLVVQDLYIDDILEWRQKQAERAPQERP